MRLKRVEKPKEVFNDLVEFVFSVYAGTGGEYPVLEWVEERPSPDDPEGFRRVYAPFLKFRLEEEFDELYLLYERGTLVGTVALVYRFGNKGLWWVPEYVRDGNSGLVEFLMVSPRFEGRGYGSYLLNFATERLRGMGRVPYIITFPHLKAYGYYLRRGFVKVGEYEEFVVLTLNVGR